MESIVDEEQRSNHMWVPEWNFEPGEESQIQAEIDKIRLKLLDLAAKGLSRADEETERKRLWAKQDELEEQLKDAKPDRWVKGWAKKADGTYLTEAERWKDADLAGKREILKETRIRFRWDEDRQPQWTMVPLWMETEADATSA
jgi:hypothetical protein